MRISEMLNAIASWLESPNNEALLLSETDDKCMKIVSESCVLAAALLKNAAAEVDTIEPPEESKITPESIQEIASLAAAFDASGDAGLKKQASVLDELLLSIAAPPGSVAAKKAVEDSRMDTLRQKYKKPSEELAKTNMLTDAAKVVQDSGMTKEYRVLEAALSTRTCPDHHGAQIARVGEHTWQCSLDKKIYNFDTGFTLANGKKVPGGDVANQTKHTSEPTHAIFDSREGRLGYNT